MRFFIPAVLAFVFLATPSQAACTDTVQSLLQRSSGYKPQLFKLKPDGLKKLVAKVNKNRALKSMEPLDADLFIAGHFTIAGVPQVGIALAYNGCVVTGTSFVIEPSMFVRILLEAGLSADDLEPFKGGIES